MAHVHGNNKFQDEFYIEAYEYARAGLLDSRIAEIFEVTPQTFSSWKKNNPAFAKALEKGRQPMTINAAGAPTAITFRDYVYNRLDPALQHIWDEIINLEKPGANINGWTILQEMLERGGYRMRQRLFMHALFHSNFNVTEACRLVCITRKVFEAWMGTDPEFAALVREMNTIKGDFFEEKLIQLVRMGDSAATIHANKTFNRDRGYNDRVEVSVTHEASANMITAEDLRGLAPEILRAVLDHIKLRRDAKAQEAKALPVHQIETPVTVEARHVQ